MVQEQMSDAKTRMHKAVEALQHELLTVRTGRASPGLVEQLKVEYYGAPTPLLQLATISAPDAKLIVISPYDKTAIGAIEKAIQKSDLGLQPSNDGAVIRLNIPPLTEERRKELAKHVRKRVEEARVAVRNVRRDGMDLLKKLEKDGKMSEDDHKKNSVKVQELTDKLVKEIDQTLAGKEVEIQKV